MILPTSEARESGATSARDPSHREGKKTLAHTGTSEAHLRQTLDLLPVLAWFSHPYGSNQFFNKPWHQYTGVSPEAPQGDMWKLAIHPDDLPAFTTNLEVLHTGNTPSEYEARLRRSDGLFRWFLFRVEPRFDEAGQVEQWFGTATDIEDRKRAEALRGAEKRLLEMIANDEAITAILEDLCAAIDMQAPGATSFVCLMDEDGRHLRPCAGPRVPTAFLAAITPYPIGPNKGSCGTAAFTKRRVIIPDVSIHSKSPGEFRELALTSGIHAAWSEPLIAKNGEVLGTFCISYGEPHAPEKRDLELIEAAGNIARIAIERERSKLALRKAFDHIQESAATLRRTIDTIPTLAWCSLPDASNEFFNQRWHDYTGLPPQEAHGWGWQVTIHPEDLQPLIETWRKLLISSEPGELEARLRRHDGQYRWFLFRVEPFKDQFGTVVRWYGTNTDIDDLKQAQIKLLQDEEELRRITDVIPQAIVVLNPEGLSLYANRVFLDYTGLSLEDARSESFRMRVFHPEDIERVDESRRNSLVAGIPFENEQRVLRRDGQYRWFLNRYNPFVDEQGQVLRWYATGTDIDDLKRAEEQIRNENLTLREDIVRTSMFEEIIGSSSALRIVLNHVQRVAPSDSTVLILGETGTGKELIARAIHKSSNRSARAFVRVNCAAIPAPLIASELFGHEKGAFTGAMQRRLGRFEAADGGTIFLDEIGDLPAETQISLLRVLQEREFERVGSNRPIAVDVRVLAATNRNLNADVLAGSFRQDLFYRLNVFPLEVPSLRERVDDIPLLLEYFIERYARRVGKVITSITKQTVRLFQTYDWPGNIRELQNVVERGVLLSDSSAFAVDEAWFKMARPQGSRISGLLASALEVQEKEMIEAALAECDGRVAGPRGAAAKLGIPRQTLDSRIASLKISKQRFKSS